MHIKRDYSQPFFGGRRRRRSYGRLLLIFGAFMVGLLLFVFTQFDLLQNAALAMVGMLPTPTPLPSELAQRAVDLFRSGDLPGSAALWAQVVEQRPDDIDYLYEYGQVLVELDDYQQPLELAERAVDLSPRDPRGHALKIKALAFSGNSSEAISLGAVALQIDPEFAQIHAALSRAYADAGRYEEALEYGLRAVELDPALPDAHRSYAYALTWVGLNEEAIDQLDQALALNPGMLALYFELASQYLALNRDQEAIDTYDAILSLQPRHAKALLRQCQAYRKVGQFDRARGYCQDAVSADPDYAPAQLQIGIILYNDRDFAGALQAFERCFASDLDSLECMYRRGLAHYYLGECDLAWSILQESLLVAETRGEVDAALDNIREGLTAITRDCPGYGGLLATPTLALTPTPGAEG